MRYDYKIIPVSTPHPAYPDEDSIWVPVLPIRLSYGHGKQTPRIDAVIDSGSGDTLFRADIGDMLGINVLAGKQQPITGVVEGASLVAYYHHVNLWVGVGMMRIAAGFVPKMSVGALLGRHGFFENFIVNFDPTSNPPGFEIQRVSRA